MLYILLGAVLLLINVMSFAVNLSVGSWWVVISLLGIALSIFTIYQGVKLRDTRKTRGREWWS